MTPAVVANVAAAALYTLKMGDFVPQLVVEQLQELAIDHLKSVMELFMKAPSLLEQTERRFHPAPKQNIESKGVLTEGIMLAKAMVGYEIVTGLFLSPEALAAVESIAKRSYRCVLESIPVTTVVEQQIRGEFAGLFQRSCEQNFQGGKEGPWDTVLRPKFQELMKDTIRSAFSKKSTVGRQIREIEKKIRFNQLELQARAEAPATSIEDETLTRFYLKMSQKNWNENASEIRRNVSILYDNSRRIKIGQDPHRKSSY
jgi:hypothetical protein